MNFSNLIELFIVPKLPLPRLCQSVCRRSKTQPQYPVGNNATLSFRAYGNLVLADYDGHIVWLTGTANKGVMGFEMMRNGNMALYNAKGQYLWQSFIVNLRFITFDNVVDYRVQDTTFTFYENYEFPNRDSERQLPCQCGNFGLCDEYQCMACLLATGFSGWSKDCAPRRLTSCNPSNFGYNKLVGVNHSSSGYTKGIAAEVRKCDARCTKHCKYAG